MLSSLIKTIHCNTCYAARLGDDGSQDFTPTAEASDFCVLNELKRCFILHK